MRSIWAVAVAGLVACSSGSAPKDEGTRGVGCVDEVPYDGIDQDCSGEDLTDVDGDGFDAVVAGGDDCNDDDADISPDAAEVPYDGVDQDCADGDLVDVDGDGHDAEQVGGTDCNDEDPDVHPDAPDLVDGKDQDCDGLDGTDADGDGYPSIATDGDDCDDLDDQIHPGATEVWYDNVDQDCDRSCDYDQDGDGFVLDGYVPADNGGCDTDPAVGVVSYAADCDDLDLAATDNFLLATHPADLDVDVFNLDPIRVDLTHSEPTTTLAVTDAAGATVTGTTTWDLDTLVFTPDAPLPALQSFDASVTWSCGTHAWSFTSADFGGPLDPTTLIGRSYEVDLDSGTWVQPAGIGALLGIFIDVKLLLGVDAATPTTLDFLGASSLPSSDQQDLCFETVAFPTADFSTNPLFALGPADVALAFAGVGMLVEDFQFGGAVSSAGDVLANGTLAGSVDTRPMVDLVAPGGSDDAVCLLAAAFGVSCIACPDGSGTYCLEMLIEDLQGDEVVGQTLVPRTPADIAADPGCP